MLRHKFFHRAKKIPVSEQELKARSKRKEKKKDKDEADKKEKSEAEEEKKTEDAESSHAEEKKEKGRKRKIRLDMHLEQVFVDGSEAYVWIYDPVPYYYWLAGGAVVLAVVALCLFPLWPPIVRKGVYYLSVAAVAFLMFILGLAVLRVVVFCGLWLASLGKHHLWLFPNLTEDVGFFASFWPVYKYEYKGKETSSKKGKKGKKGKEKDSDDENEGDDVNDGENETENENENENEQSSKQEPISCDADKIDQESDGEGSQNSNESQKSAGKDFEMVEAEDEKADN